MNNISQKTNSLEKWLLEKKYRLYLFIFLFGILLKLVFLFASVIWRVDLFFYIQGASVLNDGGVLYKDFGDIKPPGIFFLYYGLMQIFGYEGMFWAIKFSLLFFQTATAFLLFELLSRWVEKRIAFYTTFFFLLATTVHYQLWEPNIMFLMLLPLTLFVFFLTAHNGKPSLASIGASGFFLGIGFLFSTNLLFYTLLYPFWFYRIEKKFSRVLLSCVFAGLGFLLPLGLVFFYFYSHNALSDWYWWNYEWASIYGGAYPLWLRIWKFFYAFIKNWEWFFLYIPVFAMLKKIIQHKLWKEEKIYFISLFFLAALLSRLVLGKDVERYQYYFLLAFLFLFAFHFDWIQKISSRWKMIASGVIGFLVIFSFYQGFRYSNNPIFEQRSHIYRWIVANTEPNEKIFVWDEGYEWYFMTKRKMATTFFSPSQHLDYPYIWQQNKNRDIDRVWQKFLKELKEEKPVMIIDLSGNFSKEKEKKRDMKLQSYINEMQEWIGKNYFEIKREDFGNIVIYKKRK